jgi:hypothetical protein
MKTDDHRLLLIMLTRTGTRSSNTRKYWDKAELCCEKWGSCISYGLGASEANLHEQRYLNLELEFAMCLRVHLRT